MSKNFCGYIPCKNLKILTEIFKEEEEVDQIFKENGLEIEMIIFEKLKNRKLKKIEKFEKHLNLDNVHTSGN